MENTQNKIPFFKLILSPDINDEKGGVAGIAAVDQPATMQNWFYQSKENNFEFKVQNPSKRIITSPVLIPDLPIIRYTKTGESFFIMAEKELIELAVKKFFKLKLNHSINEMHTNKLIPAFVYESWIVVNPDSDKSKSYGFTDVKEGTWFVTLYIEDEQYWNDYILTRKFKGLSMEGLFQFIPVMQQSEAKPDENLTQEIIEILQQILSTPNN